MYKKNKVFIDFDGVIVDTEERLKEDKKEKDIASWEKYMKTVDWKKLLQECKEIRNSLKILKELDRKQRNINIFTKINSLEEGKLKVEYIRDHDIYVPILFSVPGIQKKDVYMPRKNEVLIDDSRTNIKHWIENGGIGYLFQDKEENIEEGKVKTLEFLLK